MLSAPDRTVVERDPALPGLAILLDPEAVTALVARLYPEAQVRSAAATYLRYKPAISCLVGYRLAVGSGETLAYARASRLDSLDKVHKGTLRTPVPSALGAGVRVETSTGITIFPFPYDLELRALARFAEEHRRRDLLRDLLPDHPKLWDAALEPLRHKPERRFVGRLRVAGEDRDGSPAALLKLFSEPAFEGSIAALERLHSDPPLVLPAVLGLSRRYRACATEWLRGRPLDQLIAGAAPCPTETLRLAGAALARLHCQDARLERVIDRRAIVSSARATARDLAFLQPELDGRVDVLLARLEELLDDGRPTPEVTIHGDFSPDQVVALSGEVSVVDLDGAGRGEALIDLAWFAGSLLAATVIDGLDRARAKSAFRALLAGYQDISTLDAQHRLRALTGAALLRRAVEPFRLRVAGWPAANEALLAEAEAMAEVRQESEVLP